MKPILITVKSINNEDVIILSKEELEALIDKVYEQGKADGQALEKPVISYPVPFPQYPLKQPWDVPSPDSTGYPQITWTASSGVRLCTAPDGTIQISTEKTKEK